MKGRKKNKPEKEPAYPDLFPTTPCLPQDTEWEDHSQRLAAILRVHSLPLVVKCHQRDLPSMARINFDFTQPLLLHTQCTVRKVVVSNVLPGLQEVGQRLLIPENYKGWFAVFSHPNNVKPDTVVPHFRQVAHLALSKCRQFLIGGEKPMTAIQMPSSSGSLARTQNRHVYPGDVLTMGQLFVGETTVTVKKSKLFGGNRTFKKKEKFLLCTDDNDRDLYLPVDTQGVFYVISTEGGPAPRIPIMTMKDILARFHLPCVVKLVFGRVPCTPCSFTGLMLLHEHVTESSVIGCTMLNARNILLDMPIDTDLRFCRASPSPSLLSCLCYKNAVSLCQDKVSTYIRNIKVAYYTNGENKAIHRDRDEQEEMKMSDSSCGKISPARPGKLSHTPSVAEDQEIFCPPETSKGPTDILQTSKNLERKQSWESPASSDTVFTVSGSPPVLTKDQTFYLQEGPDNATQNRSKQQKSSQLSNSASNPVTSHKFEESRRSGQYMHMSPPTAPSLQTATESLGDQTLPPPLPPKPSRLIFPDHTMSDEQVYSIIWVGDNVEEKQEPMGPESTSWIRSVDLRDPGPDACSMPASRPRQRSSTFGFGDNYLTLPLYYQSDAHDGQGTIPSRDSGSNSSTISQSKLEGAGNEKMAVSLSNVAQTISSCVADHPYEIVSALSARGADTHTFSFKDDTQSSQPTTAAKDTSSKTQNPTTLKTTTSKPLLPLPSQRGEPSLASPKKNPQSCSETFSSTVAEKGKGPASSQNQTEGRHVTEHQVKADSESEHTHQSRSGHEWIQQPQTLLDECSHEQGDEHEHRDQDLSDAQSQEVIVYENVKNLHSCPMKTSTSSDNVMYDMTDNKSYQKTPTSSLGNRPFPSYRPLSMKPPPLPPKRCFDKDSRIQSTNMKTSFESACSGDDVVFRPLPPPSSRNSVDDLPLGATFQNFTLSDSGCGVDSVAGIGHDSIYGTEKHSLGSSSLSSLSVQQLGQALQRVGVSQDTVDILWREKVDGVLLRCLSEDDLLDTLVGIKKLDVRKILMFLTGWTPRE